MNKQIIFLIRTIYRLIVLVLCTCTVVWFLLTLRSKCSSDMRKKSMNQIYSELVKDVHPYQVATGKQETISKPVKHVAFLKVHKTGSSTAQNIFLRYVWRNNLTLVLPPTKNAFHYPNIISLIEGPTQNNTLPPPAGKRYEILCNHVIYDRKSFRAFMPNDTVYIGILREPYEYFKSAVNYLRVRYIMAIKAELPASLFLKDPLKYEPKRPLDSYTNNRMAIEFGCSEETIQSRKPELIEEFIRQTTNDFQLVLIAEHFEESVVLMRRYLNWSTRDVVYINKNVAIHKDDKALVGPLDRQLYKRHAKVDYALYEHFYRRFRHQIKAEGADFDDELLQFKEVRKMVSEFCRQKRMDAETKLVIDKTKWSDEFEIRKPDCDLIKKSEIDFVQDIREKQYGSRDI